MIFMHTGSGFHLFLTPQGQERVVDEIPHSVNRRGSPHFKIPV